MSFKVGDTVVYPHHGAARIEAVESRSIKGEEKTYLVLKVDKGDLTVRVPADNAELVGVRDVVGQEGLERVFEVTQSPSAASWSMSIALGHQRSAHLLQMVRPLSRRYSNHRSLQKAYSTSAMIQRLFTMALGLGCNVCTTYNSWKLWLGLKYGQARGGFVVASTKWSAAIQT